MSSPDSSEDRSYFTLLPQKDAASRESTPVSPRTVLPTRQAAPPRLIRHDRHQRSDPGHGGAFTKPRIPTIDDDSPELTSGSELSRRALGPSSVPQSSGIDDTAAPSNLSEAALPSGVHTATLPPRRPRVGHEWARSTSGGLWYERKKSSTRNSKQSSGSSALYASDDKTPPGPFPSKHMIHPSQPRPSQPQDQHMVNMEIPFTEVMPHTIVAPSGESSRRSSLRPKSILIAPFSYIRKIGGPSRRHGLMTPDNQREAPPFKELPSGRALDHGSSQIHAPTGQALRQVSAVLYSMAMEKQNKRLPSKPTTVSVSELGSLHHRTPQRQLSDLSGSSEKPSKQPFSRVQLPKLAKRALTGLLSPLSLYSKRKSHLEKSDAASYTSSILNLKMGVTPIVTPKEEATYKIKRSPSAETEKFLKIDISIRGGTSYLPSEARRIHTPPLPDDRAGETRRGYCFDDWEAKNAMRGGVVPRRTATKECKNMDKDWFDVQFEELDNSHDLVDKALRSVLRRRENDGEIDYDIPEHLPTNPLCPRHPKYWRTVDGKGSQYRGCWMHGHGLEEMVGSEKLKPTTSPRSS